MSSFGDFFRRIRGPKPKEFNDGMNGILEGIYSR